ncbi:hypothetical protein [Singulisphaera sp. PoT]|uniref:hypothetical protein n=1 Tax=Singulisphaera sp. PoT TaxID=3411797 RepID=UPI003BF4A586
MAKAVNNAPTPTMASAPADVSSDVHTPKTNAAPGTLQAKAPAPTRAQAVASAPAPAPAPAPPPAAVATTASKPKMPTWTRDSDPDPTRPVPVPAMPPTPAPSPPAQPTRRLTPQPPVMAPAPTRVVRYFPLFDSSQKRAESLWEFTPPDPLGVRTAIARDADLQRASLSAAATTPVTNGYLSGMTPVMNGYQAPAPANAPCGCNPSAQPGQRKSWLSRMFPMWSTCPDQASHVHTPSFAPQPAPSSGVIPASVLVPTAMTRPDAVGPMLDVGTPLGTKYGVVKARDHDEKVLHLELATDNDRTYAAQRVEAKPSGGFFGMFPASKPNDVKRESPVGRFMRRIQGASNAFVDPDSVRRKANDLPQGTEGIQRVSAERIDKTPQR